MWFLSKIKKNCLTVNIYFAEIVQVNSTGTAISMLNISAPLICRIFFLKLDFDTEQNRNWNYLKRRIRIRDNFCESHTMLNTAVFSRAFVSGQKSWEWWDCCAEASETGRWWRGCSLLRSQGDLPSQGEKLLYCRCTAIGWHYRAN